jgi:triphosphatase
MHEIELKFGIAPERLAAVRRAVLRPGVPALRLQAAYYDTADSRLAAAGMALRLRNEGGAWVQTLKAGLDPMRRLEHNVPIAVPRGAVPALDPARHHGSPAGQALRAVLGEAGEAELVNRFATDVTRHLRVLRGRGATVELALDEGVVLAGARREPLCELEIELLRGTPAALIDLARRWAGRLGLWLDVRSKSWRGETLARGLSQAPAVKAAAPVLDAQATVDQAWRAVLQCCLDQVLANASELAAPQPDAAAPASPDHVHQLRVGLRRLRSALRLFERQVPIGEGWAGQLAGLFAELGRARDRDVFLAEALPALQAAGAPDPAAWVAQAAPPAGLPPGPLLRSPAVTQLWLELLAAVHAAPAVPVATAAAAGAGVPVHAVPSGAAWPHHPPPPDSAPSLPWRGVVAGQLRRWHKRMRRSAARLDRLGDDELHRLRRRAKRLRYAIEFSAGLWPARRLARQLEALRLLQDTLGQWNDLKTAQARFEALAAQDGRAWFAVGWARARCQALRAQAAGQAQQWAEAPVPWRGAKRGGKG